MSRRRLLLACAAAALLAPPALHAQDTSARPPEPAPDSSRFSTRFGLGAGMAIGQGTGMGLHLLGSAQLEVPRLPFALRLDGQVSQWDRNGATSRISALTTSAVLPLRDTETGWRPFVLAGVGAYAGSGTGLRPGWTAGLGVEVPVAGRSLLVEWRYHQWSPAAGHRARYSVPLTIGLRF